MKMHILLVKYFRQLPCFAACLTLSIAVRSIAAGITAPAYAFAEGYDLPPFSSINLSVGKDSDNNRNIQLQLNIELEKYQQISAGYGKSISDIPSLDTAQSFIGVATNPYESFSIGTSYSIWGKNNSLETRSLKSDIFINLEQWSFSTSPQLHVVTFYGVNNTRKFDLYSKAISLSATYYGFENYFGGINIYENKYADTPFFLDNRTLTEISAVISESAQLLMSGLEKSRVTLSAGRFFNWGSLEADWSQSEASFVGGKIYITSIMIDYRLNKRLNINLITSRQTSTFDDNSLTAIDIGMGLSW